VVFKILLIGYFVGMGTYDSATRWSKLGDHAPKGPLYGIYNVETFVRNNDTIPPLQTDTIRWKQLVVGGYHDYTYAVIKGMNDGLTGYEWRPDSMTKKIEMFPYDDSSYKNQISYHFPDKEHLEMRGSWRGDSLYVKFKVYELNNFLLVKRGYRWINEYPYNR
jgi:hypothetical protein